MKVLVTVSGVMLALTNLCAAITPADEMSFLDVVRDALIKRDKTALRALICWDQVTKRDLDAASGTMDDMLSRPIKSVNYLLLRSTKPPTYTRDGVLYGPNLVITHEIEVEYEDVRGLRSFQHETFYCGEKDGRLMIIVMTPRS